VTLELICPRCRSITDERIDLRTLARRGEVMECACGERYPIVDGVPIVLPRAHADLASVVERDLAPEVAALLVAELPDDAPYARLLEHVSIYMDACWGDRATPAVDLGVRAIVEKLAALPRVARAVELGAGVGRGVAELARNADHVIGLDLHFGTLRRARKLLDGEPVAYARRIVGRRYAAARVEPGGRAVPAARRTLVCGDALDPPLAPGAFDRVVALNLLDAVSHPNQLISVIDALCAPGGEIVIASPYTWQSGIVVETERLGGDDPAAYLRARLERGDDLRARFRVEDEAELPWTLRRDARSEVIYRVHYLRARKLDPGAAV
jgi:SAM-dependent methyltransferase